LFVVVSGLAAFAAVAPAAAGCYCLA
jgi:uncharacterized membrane protein